jgi:hypothetical protein
MRMYIYTRRMAGIAQKMNLNAGELQPNFLVTAEYTYRSNNRTNKLMINGITTTRLSITPKIKWQGNEITRSIVQMINIVNI